MNDYKNRQEIYEPFIEILSWKDAKINLLGVSLASKINYLTLMVSRMNYMNSHLALSMLTFLLKTSSGASHPIFVKPQQDYKIIHGRCYEILIRQRCIAARSSVTFDELDLRNVTHLCFSS